MESVLERLLTLVQVAMILSNAPDGRETMVSASGVIVTKRLSHFFVGKGSGYMAFKEEAVAFVLWPVLGRHVNTSLATLLRGQ
jgi:hypothetical protein